METAPTKSRRTRDVNAPLSSTNRSKVTNASALFVEGSLVDGRTATARRFRDLVAAITSDLGGAAGLSEGQRQMIRRAATLALQCELLEQASVAGQPIDLDLYGTMTDRLGRALSRIGLKRVAKDIGPSIQDVVQRIKAKQQ